MVIGKIVTDNVKKVIDSLDGGAPTRAARRLKMNQRTLDRYYKGEQIPSVEAIERIASGSGLEPWHMMIPDLDIASPPIVSQQTKEERELYARLKSTIDGLTALKR